ncbi:hypothetical protein [Salinactinospora qingdaonensis]|uniref:DUF350 domain-containing protein n=1 Tax=Salinactinospora qingdaonensis TaxID=702744 RepID=A0ABP7FBP2_9ACTN
MDWLISVAVFGIASAVLTAAGVGLLLVFADRAGNLVVQGLVGALSLFVLVALPSMAAATTLSRGSGFAAAVLAACCVVVIGYVVGMALLPAVARRAAIAAPRLSAASVAGGVVVCVVLGVIGAGLGAAFS